METQAGQNSLGIKSCRICHSQKETSLFVKSKAFKSGYDTICLDCSRQKVRLWRKENRDKHNELNRLYQKRYPKLITAKTRKYQLSRLKRLPSWANIEKIKQIYQECPEGYEVDHIIPLRGELVSGLHVEYNLQYLPILENKRKSNKWMPT